MKKFLIAAALMFAVPAQAQVINEEMCVSLGNIGGKAMKLRQLGVPKERVLSVVATSTDSIANQLMIAVINFAYGMPISTSPDTIDELATNKCLEVVYNDRYPAST